MLFLKRSILMIFFIAMILISCGDEKVLTVIVTPYFNENANQQLKKEQRYLELGLADEMIRRLSTSRKLRVISLGEIMQKIKYSQMTGDDVSEQKWLTIAKDLQSDLLLIGRFSFNSDKNTNILALSAKVFNQKNSELVTNATASGSVDQWNKKRQELIIKLSKKLGLKLTDHEKKTLATAYTNNFSAFMQNYIGLAHYYQAKEAELNNAVDEVRKYREMATYYFLEAMKLDQSYNLAREYLAENNFSPGFWIPVQDKVQGVFSLMTLFSYKQNEYKKNLNTWINHNGGGSKIVGMINALPSGFFLEIQGHTSADEDDVSRDRAKYVYDYLRNLGAKSNRIQYIGFGDKEHFPWTEKKDPTNRRVTFSVKSN